MRRFPEKLGPRQQRFLTALLSSSSVQGAAGESGISVATAWRYLADDAFVRAYAHARRDLIEHVSMRLQNGASRCADVLTAIAGDGEVPASARVTAARSVIELALKTYEVHDLQNRFKELERSLTYNPFLMLLKEEWRHSVDNPPGSRNPTRGWHYAYMPHSA